MKLLIRVSSIIAAGLCGLTAVAAEVESRHKLPQDYELPITGMRQILGPQGSGYSQ